MALVKYTSGVNGFHGSIGGTTFQTAGKYLIARKRPFPFNPNNVFQGIPRSILTLVVQAWQQLGDSDRGLWNSVAIAQGIPTRKDIASFINGYNYFVKLNCWRQLVNLPIMVTPVAAPFHVGNPPFSILWASEANVTLTLTAPLPADVYGLVFVSDTAATQSAIQNATKKYVNLVPPNSSSSEFSIPFQSKFGHPLEVGNYLRVGFVIIAGGSYVYYEYPSNYSQIFSV